MGLQLDLMPLEEKLPDAPPPKTMVVRYGYLKEIGEFHSDITSKVGCGTKLVIRTDRGTEMAEMLTTACGNGGCSKSITRDKLLAYIDNSGGRDYPFTDQGRVLRVATVQDLAEQAKLDEHHHEHLRLAHDLVIRHNLQMKIVDVEHLLGGERVLFYFISEHRIDFRGIVRDLAHDLHTRIEMRQVGARDEARLTADYEKCGQHCCCKQFLKVLTPISMRAAKVQKATLDPTKISGRCGRLMCCLRYEDEAYEELRKKLPKRNTRVKTEKADAWVIDGQILTQLVLVQFDDGTREAIPMEKILDFNQPKPVMADGRTMQTPNDRPPMAPGAMPPQMGPDGKPMRGPLRAAGGPPGRGGPGGPGGAGAPPAQRRPMPGAPLAAGQGDPLAATGPTGGDLNVTGAGDEIDDLIADAMDAQSSATADAAPGANPVAGPETEEDPRAEKPMSPPPAMGQGGPGAPRGNMPGRPPQQRGQQQGGGGGQRGQQGPPRGQGPRPPQRPPMQNRQMPPRPMQGGQMPSPPAAPEANQPPVVPPQAAAPQADEMPKNAPAVPPTPEAPVGDGPAT